VEQPVVEPPAAPSAVEETAPQAVASAADDLPREESQASKATEEVIPVVEAGGNEDQVLPALQVGASEAALKPWEREGAFAATDAPEAAAGTKDDALSWADRLSSSSVAVRKRAFEAIGAATARLPSDLEAALVADDGTMLKRLSNDSSSLCLEAGCAAVEALLRSPRRSIVLQHADTVAWYLATKGITMIKPGGAKAAEGALESIAKDTKACRAVVGPCLSLLRDTHRPRPIPAALRILTTAVSVGSPMTGFLMAPVKATKKSTPPGLQRSTPVSPNDVVTALPNLLMMSSTAPDIAKEAVSLLSQMLAPGSASTVRDLANDLLQSQKATSPQWEAVNEAVQASLGALPAQLASAVAAASGSAPAKKLAKPAELDTAATAAAPHASPAIAISKEDWEAATPKDCSAQLRKADAPTALKSSKWAVKSEALDLLERLCADPTVPRLAPTPEIIEAATALTTLGVLGTHPVATIRSAGLLAAMASRLRQHFSDVAPAAFQALLSKLKDKKKNITDACVEAAVVIWRCSLGWGGVQEHIHSAIASFAKARNPAAHALVFQTMAQALVFDDSLTIKSADLKAALLLCVQGVKDVAVDVRVAAESAFAALAARLAACSSDADKGRFVASHKVCGPLLRSLEADAPKSYRRILASIQDAGEELAAQDYTGASTLQGRQSTSTSPAGKSSVGAAPPTPPKATSSKAAASSRHVPPPRLPTAKSVAAASPVGVISALGGASAIKAIPDSDVYGAGLPSADASTEADLASTIRPEGIKDLGAAKWQDKANALQSLGEAAVAASALSRDSALAVLAVLKARTDNWKSLSNANLLTAVLTSSMQAVAASAGISTTPVPMSSDLPEFASTLLEHVPAPGPAAVALADPKEHGLPRTAAQEVLAGLAIPKLKERKGGNEASSLIMVIAAACGPSFVASLLAEAAYSTTVPAIASAAMTTLARIVRAFGASRLGSARDVVIDATLSPNAGWSNPKPAVKDPALAVLMAMQAQMGSSAVSRLLSVRQSSSKATAAGTKPTKLSDAGAKGLASALEAAIDVVPFHAEDTDAAASETRDGPKASSLSSVQRVAARLAATAATLCPQAIGPAYVRPQVDPAIKQLSAIASHSGDTVSEAATASSSGDGSASKPSGTMTLAAASFAGDLPRQPLKTIIPASVLADMGMLVAESKEAGAPRAWKVRDDALSAARAALDEAGPGGVDATSHIREVVPAVVARLADTNANLKPKAAGIIASLCSSCGSSPLSLAFPKTLFPALADLVGDSKKVVKDAAIVALTALTASEAAFVAAAASRGGALELDPATAIPEPGTIDAAIGGFGNDAYRSKSAGPSIMEWTAQRLEAAMTHKVPVSPTALAPVVSPAVVALASKAQDSRSAASKLVTVLVQYGAAKAVQRAADALKPGVKMMIQSTLDQCLASATADAPAPSAPVAASTALTSKPAPGGRKRVARRGKKQEEQSSELARTAAGRTRMGSTARTKAAAPPASTAPAEDSRALTVSPLAESEKAARIRRARLHAKDQLSTEAMSVLRGDWEAAGCASQALLDEMFSSSDTAHHAHEASMVFLREAIGSNAEAVAAVSDLVARLCAVRIRSLKMTVQTAALACLNDWLVYLRDAGVALASSEAHFIIAPVLEEAGAKRAALRASFGECLRLLSEVMGAKPFCRAIVTALPDTRNMKSVSDALEAMARALTTLEEDETAVSPKSALGKEGWKLIGSYLSNSNAEVRGSALAVIHSLWTELRGDMTQLKRILVGTAALGTKAEGILEGKSKEWIKEAEAVPAKPSVHAKPRAAVEKVAPTPVTETPAPQDPRNVSAFLSEIEKWVGAVGGAPAPPTDVFSPVAGFSEEPSLPSTPVGKDNGAEKKRQKRRETAVHIGSNEIRRALSRTQDLEPLDEQEPASPQSVGSVDSGLRDHLIGSQIDLGESMHEKRRESLLGASALAASTAAKIPKWLKDIHGDVLAAAFLLERARHSGKHAAVLDSGKYSKGLAALATLLQRIKDCSTSKSSSRSAELTETLARSASMIVKAVTTLLTHASGGAVRFRGGEASPPGKALPAGAVALPGLAGKGPSPASIKARHGLVGFSSSGGLDEGYCSAAVDVLNELFIRPSLSHTVSDRSLNALLTECMLRMVDDAAPARHREVLSRLVLRAVHRSRHDASICAIVDLLARADTPESGAVDEASLTDKHSKETASPLMGRTMMPLRTTLNLARLLTRVVMTERSTGDKTAVARSASTPYGGDFDVGALVFSLHQFLETHSSELRSTQSSNTGVAGQDPAVTAATLPPPRYAQALPVRSCLVLLRDLAKYRPEDVWSVIEGMTMTETIAESDLSGLGRDAVEAGMPVMAVSAIRTLFLRYMALEHGAEAMPPTATEAVGDGFSTAEAAVLEYSDIVRWAVSCVSQATDDATAERERAQCDSMVTEGVAELLDLEERADGAGERLERVLDAVREVGGDPAASLLSRLAAGRIERLKSTAPTTPTPVDTVDTPKQSARPTGSAGTPVGVSEALAKIYRHKHTEPTEKENSLPDRQPKEKQSSSGPAPSQEAPDNAGGDAALRIQRLRERMQRIREQGGSSQAAQTSIRARMTQASERVSEDLA
jgi:hypothetical protein